jgi:hypothetical protein
MALTGQDLLKARNVRVAAGYDDSIGLTMHVVDGPLWRAAYGRANNGLGVPAVVTVSPIGSGATDIAALSDLFAKMATSTAARAAAEATNSTAAAAIATAVAAAAA